MPDNSSVDISAQLHALRDLFQERLNSELPALERSAASLATAGDHEETLNFLHHTLHKLAGSAGTFGFAELGKEARRLEIEVRSWLESGEVPAANLPAFLRGVRSLRRGMNVPSGEGGQSQEIAPQPVSSSEVKDSPLICLVEDDHALSEELKRVFGHFGYRVEHHDRLTTAAKAISGHKPEALIMDVVFHDNGLNTIEQVALHPVFRELDRPIIFLSDQDDFHARVQAARVGAEGFFLKPLDIPKLIDRLEQSLRHQHRPPYRLLIVDDDDDLARHYAFVLRNAGMEVKTVSNPEMLLEVMTEFHPELILMDLAMPGYDGIDLARVIRMHDEWVSLPIIYLSAETDMDKQLSAMHSGGDDFLTKPISDEHLAAAVAVRAARMRQLSELMTKDSLTGLLKHSRIKEQIALDFARSRRGNKPLCVGMLDIDHFKVVNDNYGHAMGDQVIKALAHLLKQRLRKTDSIGRYGGEEFAVALPDCDARAAFELLEDIRVRFKEIRFNAEGKHFSVTLSAGAVDAKSFENASDMLIAADEALYAAKRGGRDRVVMGGRFEGEGA